MEFSQHARHFCARARAPTWRAFRVSNYVVILPLTRHASQDETVLSNWLSRMSNEMHETFEESTKTRWQRAFNKPQLEMFGIFAKAEGVGIKKLREWNNSLAAYRAREFRASRSQTEALNNRPFEPPKRERSREREISGFGAEDSRNASTRLRRLRKIRTAETTVAKAKDKKSPRARRIAQIVRTYLFQVTEEAASAASSREHWPEPRASRDERTNVQRLPARRDAAA